MERLKNIKQLDLTHCLQSMYDAIEEYQYLYTDGYNEIKNALKELEEYRHIEHELGFELTKLFKALEDGVWAYEYENKPIHRDVLSIKNQYGLSLICQSEKPFEFLELRFGNYGYEWALTREELEEK